MVIDIVLAYAEGKGGLEDVITTFSKELIKRGHRVRVFQAYKPKYKEWIETIDEIYFFGDKDTLENDNKESLAKNYKNMILKIGEPDVVLATHSPLLSYICYKAVEFLKDKRPKILSWIHGSPSYYGGGQYLRYADAHLAISSQIGNEISKYIKKDKPIYYISNPVRLNEMKKININRDILELVYVGRLDNVQKRIDIMFKALSLVDCNWNLDIIGSGKDEEALKSLAKDLGIYKHIKWHGWKENPWDALESATALMLTSDEEGFGLVMVEALGRGIPVISTDTDGAKDIIIDGFNGCMVNKGDYKQLSELLESINNKNIEINPKNCIDSIQKFSADCVIDMVENIINYYDKNGEYQSLIFSTKENIKLLIENNKLDEAKKLINEYTELIKEDAEICNFKAIISMMEGDYPNAYELLKYGNIKYELSIDSIFNLAYICSLMEKTDEAIEYFNYILVNCEDEEIIKDVELQLDNLFKKVLETKRKDKNFIVDIVIYSVSGRGGTERAIIDVNKALRKRGYRVRVFQAYKTQCREWENGFEELYTYGLNSSMNEDTIESLALGYRKKLSQIGKPDIIIATHQPALCGICRLAINDQYKDSPKIISWMHSEPKLMGSNHLLKYSDGHMAVSKFIAKDINFLTDSYSICLVGNPVEENNLKVINRDNEKLNLLYMGRLENSFKRIDILFKAVSLLDKEWELTIVGSGEHEDYLKKLSKELGIQDNIRWLGWKEEPWEAIDSATALVLPSDSEAFGLVLVESLQRGLPVIVSDCEGPKDIVENCKNGFIFEKGNYEQLSNIFNGILDKNINLPNFEECIKSVKKYSVDNVLDKIEAYLLSKI
ncbi:glycosyltransferase [Paraclostridium bifermentans]|uniref:glycosyltransferase n=1 Tax=Paraclostridium bifermentans TaxID=1490 RepID=UPI00359C2609